MNFSAIRQLFVRYSLLDWIFNAFLLILLLVIKYYPLPTDYEPYFNSNTTEPNHSTTVSYTLLALIVFLIIPIILFVTWSINSFNSTIFRVLAAYYYSVLFSSFLTSSIQRITRRAKPDTVSVCGLQENT